MARPPTHRPGGRGTRAALTAVCAFALVASSGASEAVAVGADGAEQQQQAAALEELIAVARDTLAAAQATQGAAAAAYTATLAFLERAVVAQEAGLVKLDMLLSSSKKNQTAEEAVEGKRFGRAAVASITGIFASQRTAALQAGIRIMHHGSWRDGLGDADAGCYRRLSDGQWLGVPQRTLADSVRYGLHALLMNTGWLPISPIYCNPDETSIRPEHLFSLPLTASSNASAWTALEKRWVPEYRKRVIAMVASVTGQMVEWRDGAFVLTDLMAEFSR